MKRHYLLTIAIVVPALLVPAVQPDAAELQGTISCATSVCHGGAGLHEPRSEATTWRAIDPHARAYDSLLSTSAKKMADLLWPGSKKLAHQEKRCLTCHVHPGYDPERPTRNARPNFRKEDGVGCESCHGAAQHWLSPHYTRAWQQLDGATKSSKGLTATKNLAVRAGVCVGCHVGTPGTDAHVDHDLIAAGHPPLRFEFATYFANLPAHWNVKTDQARNSSKTAADFEARVWAVGQLVTSARALELRADRAASKPWPEFAELDCFACHHDLQGASWRGKQPHLANRKPGDLLWNDWHFALLPELLPDVKLVHAFGQEQQSLNRKDLFTKQGREDLAARAKTLAQVLATTAHARAEVDEPDPCFSLDWPGRLIKGRPTDRSWDAATQRYLALVAARAMRKNEEQPELDRLISKLGTEVTFRAGWNSPRVAPWK